MSLLLKYTSLVARNVYVRSAVFDIPVTSNLIQQFHVNHIFRDITNSDALFKFPFLTK
jgi:hypothetical protein